MPADTPTPDWPGLIGRADAAVRMAPLRPRPATLPGRAWRVVRRAVGRLVGGRQDRFNAETAGVVRDLCVLTQEAHQRVPQVDALWQEVATLRRDLAAARAELAELRAVVTGDLARIGAAARSAGDAAFDLTARVTHVEQHTREMARLAAAEQAALVARLDHTEQDVRALRGQFDRRPDGDWPAAPLKHAG